MSDGDRFCGGRRGYHHGRLKDALVEAARALAAQRGPAGFTLAEAAKLVGVTAAASYRHFTDRNALMGEVARRGFAQFAGELEAAWAGGAPDPVAAFRRMGEAYLGFARREPGLYAAMFGSVRALDAPASGAAADRALDALRRAARAVLDAYGATGADDKALAYEIWALAHGVAMLAVSGHLGSAADCDPSTILSSGVGGVVESAVRKAHGKAPAPRELAPKGPWGPSA